MYHKTSLTEVRLASIDRSRRGRCRRAEESQLCYFPRQPQGHAACRRLPAAAYLACVYDPRAFRSAFAIATRPLLLLVPPLSGSAALRIEAPVMRRVCDPRPQGLPRVCFADTMRMHRTFQWACRGGQPIYRGKKQ